MPHTPVRYRSTDEDSARWSDFPFRPGDIVISTRSKSGTTWLQMICALLIFQTTEPPRPLAELSPWLDWLIRPQAEVYAELAAQPHRRFIKTHTPLDGLPLDPRATHIVVARHPLDVAVSLYYQEYNIDRAKIRELVGDSPPVEPPRPTPPLPESLLSWIEKDVDPRAELDSLPGVLWHLSDAWGRRDASNVLLVHYQDLSDDLPAEMRRIARHLGIEVPATVWPQLVEAATFDRMRAIAERVAPNALGVLKSSAAFFRQGRSGAGRALLDDQQWRRYQSRAAELAPADLLAWLHREPGGRA